MEAFGPPREVTEHTSVGPVIGTVSQLLEGGGESCLVVFKLVFQGRVRDLRLT